jgi:hypothetical protein
LEAPKLTLLLLTDFPLAAASVLLLVIRCNVPLQAANLRYIMEARKLTILLLALLLLLPLPLLLPLGMRCRLLTCATSWRLPS